MQYVGAKNSITDWFELYISNRKSFITLKNVLSGAALWYYGAPQEKILGPSHFWYIQTIY